MRFLNILFIISVLLLVIPIVSGESKFNDVLVRGYFNVTNESIVFSQFTDTTCFLRTHTNGTVYCNDPNTAINSSFATHAYVFTEDQNLNTSTQTYADAANASMKSYADATFVTSVTGTSPITSSGGLTPDIGWSPADIGLGWSNLTSYPDACTSSQTITTFGDTITCSAISITESQISDLIHTGNETDRVEAILAVWLNTSSGYTQSQINDYINANSTAANESAQAYSDAEDALQNTSLKSYIFTEDSNLNDSLISRIFTDDSALNTSVRAYADAQDIAANDSIKDAIGVLIDNSTLLRLYQAGVISVDDTVIAGLTNVLTLNHTISNATNGTDGISVGLLLRAEDTVGDTEDVAQIVANLTTATNGSETGALIFFTRTSGGGLTEIARVNNSGLGVIGTTNSYGFTVNGTILPYSVGLGLVKTGSVLTLNDSSSVSDVDNSGTNVIQDLTFNSFGDVLTVTSTDLGAHNTNCNGTNCDIGFGNITGIYAGLGIVISGSTISANDSSSVSDVDNSGTNVIQDLTFDSLGNVLTVTSTDLGAHTVDTTEVWAINETKFQNNSGVLNTNDTWWTQDFKPDNSTNADTLGGIAKEDFIEETELDSESELETQLTDVSNIIVSTEIDSESELEGLLSDVSNMIISTEIDTESELEALITDISNILTTDSDNSTVKDIVNNSGEVYLLTSSDLSCTNCIGGTEIAELADADISDTLTASDLQAGGSVVADSEVDNDLTISGGTISSTPITLDTAVGGAEGRIWWNTSIERIGLYNGSETFEYYSGAHTTNTIGTNCNGTNCDIGFGNVTGIYAGLGIVISGSVISANDSSSVSDVDNSGTNVIQDLTFDSLGNVLTVTSTDLGAHTTNTDSNLTQSDINDMGFNDSVGWGLVKTGSEISLNDSSSVSDVDNSGTNVIQDLTFDAGGRTLTVTSTDLGAHTTDTIGTNCNGTNCDLGAGNLTGTVVDARIISTISRDSEVENSTIVRTNIANTIEVTDNTINGLTNILTIVHSITNATNGTAGISTGLLFRAEDAIADTEDIAQIIGNLTTTTNGSEAGDLIFLTRTAGGALTENARLDGGGTFNVPTAITVNDVNVALHSGFGGANITAGTVADARIATTLSRDSENVASGDISGNLGAGYTIDADTIDKANFADEDWGDVSVATNAVTIDEDVIDKANFADEDWGEATITTNALTIDSGVIDADNLAANSVDSSELVDGSVDLSHMSSASVDSDNIVDDTIVKADFADEDWGDGSIATNAFTLDASVVSDNEIDYGTVTLNDFTNDGSYIKNSTAATITTATITTAVINGITFEVSGDDLLVSGLVGQIKYIWGAHNLSVINTTDGVSFTVE